MAKKSDVLKRAKNHLYKTLRERGAKNKTSYICCAIGIASEELFGNYDTNIANSLRDDVESRITFCATFEQFLAEQHRVLIGELPYSYDEIQAMRHKLLDEMIKEYEAEEVVE